MDLDEGVGAFASINAMQGYRPNPVAQYAIQLMRAQRGGKELPVAPEIRAATYIENVTDFAGAYHSVDGRVLNFLAEATISPSSTKTKRSYWKHLATVFSSHRMQTFQDSLWHSAAPMRKIPSPQRWKSVGAAIGLLKPNTKARKLSTIRKDGTHISATIEMKTIGLAASASR